MRFALCNEVLRHLKWEEACRLIAEAGYEGVELAPFTFAEKISDLSEADRRAIRETAQQQGLEIVGLHWLLVSPPGFHVAHPDPQIRQRTAKYLCDLAQFAYEVGASVLVFGSPKQRSTLPPLTPDQAIHLWLETLEPALDLAAQYGLTFCLEPLPSEETDVLNRLEEAVRLIEQRGHPALRTILDVKSVLAEGRDPVELLERFYPWIAHVHLNDSNRRAPGYGSTDFRPLLATLRHLGYPGWCSVEPFDYYPTPESLTQESLRYLHHCLRE